MVGLQRRGLLLQLVDVFGQLLGARVSAHDVAVLIHDGVQAFEFGLQGGNLLVHGGGHLVRALLDEGRTLLEIGVRDRVSGLDGLGAGRRGVLDLDDRAIRVARHLHVLAQLGSGRPAADGRGRSVQDGGGLRDSLLSHHVRRVRQRRTNRGRRRERRRRHSHRYRRGMSDGYHEGSANTKKHANHSPRSDRPPATPQGVTQDLLAASRRRGEDHECSP